MNREDSVEQIESTLKKLRPGHEAKIPLEIFYAAYGPDDPENRDNLTSKVSELNWRYGLEHRLQRDAWPHKGKGWIWFVKPE